jgi:hypothetical protein
MPKAKKRVLRFIAPDGTRFTGEVSPDGIVATVYSLATDSWVDSREFLSQARLSFEDGNIRKGNRELRASLIFLFAHLEGVAERIQKVKKDEIPGVQGKRRLCDLTRCIAREARRRGCLPYLSFKRWKFLRDIVAHPGIDKADYDSPKRSVDETTVFEELTCDSLAELDSMITSWLDAVCNAFGMERLVDTKKIVEGLANKIGTPSGTTEL